MQGSHMSFPSSIQEAVSDRFVATTYLSALWSNLYFVTRGSSLVHSVVDAFHIHNLERLIFGSSRCYMYYFPVNLLHFARCVFVKLPQCDTYDGINLRKIYWLHYRVDITANQCFHHDAVPSNYPSLGTLLLNGIDGAILGGRLFLEHFPGIGRSAIRRNETGIRLELRLPPFTDFLKVHKWSRESPEQDWAYKKAPPRRNITPAFIFSDPPCSETWCHFPFFFSLAFDWFAQNHSSSS